MDFLSNPKYAPIGSSAEDLAHSKDEEVQLMPEQTGRIKHWPGNMTLVITALNVFVFAGSLICLLLSFGYFHSFWVQNADLRRTSSWSPIHDMVNLSPRVTLINGTLFPPESPSIARQPPNRAADEVWAEYELLRVMPVTRETIVKLGKDPQTAVKLEDDIWGLGNDAYGVVFDVYHQLHCLNSLRKIAYGSYYNVSQGRADTLKLREMHINHCADILFQAIQCSGNVNLMTLHWVETQEYPWPDMSINRQCIDFDRLTEFRKGVSLDMDKYKKAMAKPDGVAELPAPDQYYQLYGEANPNHMHAENQNNDNIL